MTIKQQLFNSFVKGIGKTLGTTIVIGFIGSVFYMYSNTKLYTTKEKTTNDKETTNENENHDIQMSNVNNDETHDNETQDTKTNYEDLENVVNSKYKNLFENLMK